MKTTVTVDHALLKRAGELAGVTDSTTLVNESLRALIERESARKLARLGGSHSRS